MCKIFVYLGDNKSKFQVIEYENPTDTTYLDYNERTIDSLNLLTGYVDSSMVGPKILGAITYPSRITFKVGEWDYYTESGELYRKEYYKNGLIKNISY